MAWGPGGLRTSISGRLFGVEPAWGKLPSMSPLELWAGIRARDWTDPAFDPAAPPWQISFYRDGGRVCGPSWPGYRALVRKGRPDGTFGAPAWVDLPVAGPPTYTHDALAGGTHGGAYRAKRAAPPPGTPGASPPIRPARAVQLTRTSICSGAAFASLTKCTRSRPSLNSAVTFVGLASSGSRKLLRKLP